MFTRAVLSHLGIGSLAAAALFLMATPASAQKAKVKQSTPIVSCASSTSNTIELSVCAGTTGATAGFSIQWESCADFALGPDAMAGTADDNTWFASDDPRLCKASFSGNANGSQWGLAPGACIDVVIGGLNDADPGVSFSCNDPLDCASCYVFRSFAHATSKLGRSDFSANLSCSTADCEPTGFEDGDFCTKSQGFYSSGNAGRDMLIACFGGDPLGEACLSVAGIPLVALGGGTYSQAWVTTGLCVDVQPGPNVFLLDGGIDALRTAVGGGGASSHFTADGLNATSMGAGGGLASQAAALTLNLALSGSPCSGFPAGLGDAVLCSFEEGDTFKNDGTPISAATARALNGQTVASVLAAANAYLGGAGAVAVPFELTSAADLNELLANFNLSFHDPYVDGNGVEQPCGGMSAFAESHLCH
jgi:hypothetical protein